MNTIRPFAFSRPQAVLRMARPSPAAIPDRGGDAVTIQSASVVFGERVQERWTASVGAPLTDAVPSLDDGLVLERVGQDATRQSWIVDARGSCQRTADAQDAEWEHRLADQPVGIPVQLRNGDVAVATKDGEVVCVVDAMHSADPVVPASAAPPAGTIEKAGPDWIVIGGVRVPRRH